MEDTTDTATVKVSPWQPVNWM